VDQNNNPLPNPARHLIRAATLRTYLGTILAAGGTSAITGAMIAAGYPAVAGLQPGAHYDATMAA